MIEVEEDSWSNGNYKFPLSLYTNLVHTLDSLSMGFEAEFESSLYGVSIPAPSWFLDYLMIDSQLRRQKNSENVLVISRGCWALL